MGDEEKEIKLPEFDEEEFRKREYRKAMTAFISFIFGIVIAVISVIVWTNSDSSIAWPITFLFALASIGFLAKVLQFLKIDIKSFSKKEWAGSIAFYFFTWLALFILLINPPFYDASPPVIDVVMLPEIQEIGQNASVIARITDNVEVKKVMINVSGNEYVINGEDDIYIYNMSSGKPEKFSIIAYDKENNRAVKNGEIEFLKNVIYSKNESSEINSSYEIKIWVMKNISHEKFRVYYIINGTEVNATYYGEEGNYYIYTTSPSYTGWKENSVNRIKIYAEVIHYFGDKRFSNTIYGGEYEFRTKYDSSIGKLKSPVIKGLPSPEQYRRTPGMEFAGMLAALLIVLIIFRKRR
ncbi:MAG: hypothetical protein J7K61_04655 [Thermoplasmata archaeon]|nr:hypothetical protein [Thermoplasmata archaeon]